MTVKDITLYWLLILPWVYMHRHDHWYLYSCKDKFGLWHLTRTWRTTWSHLITTAFDIQDFPSAEKYDLNNMASLHQC